MLLLIICILCIVLGIVLFTLDDRCVVDLSEGVAVLILVFMIVGGFGTLLIGGNAIGNNLEITKTRLDAKYEQLQQNKNNDYLIQDIIDWNKDLAFNKKYNDNIWIGITIPKYFSDYDYITPDK